MGREGCRVGQVLNFSLLGLVLIDELVIVRGVFKELGEFLIV